MLCATMFDRSDGNVSRSARISCDNNCALSSSGPSLTIRGRPYPILLPKLRDPRLHLAAVITSLQILGQVAFDFRVSIAQILISLATCAGLELAIAFWRQGVIMWPASALITGNGVAFILRLPGTRPSTRAAASFRTGALTRTARSRA